jgi:hypothetical protein
VLGTGTHVQLHVSNEPRFRDVRLLQISSMSSGGRQNDRTRGLLMSREIS